MPYTIPTLNGLVDRARADLNSAMGNSNALVPRTLAYAIGFALGCLGWGIYLFGRWILDQVIVDSAEGEYLRRWAALFGVVPADPAKAAGPVLVTAVAGAFVTNGDILQGEDLVQYEVTGGTGGPGADSYVWVASGEDTIQVRALATGTAGNRDEDAYLSFVSPRSGVVSRAVVGAGGLIGGTDPVSDPDLLDDLLDELRNPPQGGCKGDYEKWIREVGRANGWEAGGVWSENWREDALLDPGGVWVRFTIADGSGSGSGGVIPTVGQLGQAEDYIQIKKEMSADSHAAGLAEQYLTLELNARLATGATKAEAEAAVAAEMRSMLAEHATVSSQVTTIPNSYIQEAVGRVAEIEWFELTSVNGGGALDDITTPAYYFPTIADGDVDVTEV